MFAEPQKEHHWLQKLMGEWTYENECPGEPGKPPQKMAGTENVHSLGGLWVACEGQGQMPDGKPAKWLMTIGYDPQKKGYIGTWVGSMMTHLWVYDGVLDANGKVLTLNSDGPNFTEPGKTAKYQDIITFVTDDHRTLASRGLGEDGKWTQFMEAHYRRRK